MNIFVLMMFPHIMQPFLPVYVVNNINKFNSSFHKLYSMIQEVLSNVIKYHMFYGRSDTQPIFVQSIHRLKIHFFFW